MKDLDQVKAKVCRIATLMLIGGFRPTDDVLSLMVRKGPNGQAERRMAVNERTANAPTLPVKSNTTSVRRKDYPCWDDFSNLLLTDKDLHISEEVEDDFETFFPNVSGLKIGGWPSLIQSEIYWAPFNKRTAL